MLFKNKKLPNNSFKFKYYLLLISIFFFHLVSIIICSFQDVARELKKHPGNLFADYKKISYWLWFFSWWSAWASLLTFFWVIYRLVKKNNSTYFEQSFDLSVVIANIISGVIFTAGWILYIISGKSLLTNVPLVDGKPNLASLKPISVNFGLFQLSAYSCWIIYNIIWHIIAPLLVVYFFYCFSETSLLEKRLKFTTLFTSLINPVFWTLYVVLRPVFDHKNSYAFKKNSYDYPKDYPFSFFDRMMGKSTWRGDKYKNTWMTRLIWIIMFFISICLIVSLLAYGLIAWKRKLVNKRCKNKDYYHINSK